MRQCPGIEIGTLCICLALGSWHKSDLPTLMVHRLVYELVPIRLWEPKKEDNQLHILTPTQAPPSREQEHTSEVTASGSHVHGYSYAQCLGFKEKQKQY